MDFITQYFREEKTGVIILFLFGFVSLLIAAFVFFKTSQPIIRGLFFPLLIFGLGEAALGAGIYLRTDKQVATLQQQYLTTPALFKQEENARMERIHSNFKYVKLVELIIIAVAVVLVMFVHNKPYWTGVAVAAILHAAFLFGFDTLAAHRAHTYQQGIDAVK